MTNARRYCKCGYCGYCVNYFLDKPNRAEAPPPADSPAIASLQSAVDDLRFVGVDVEPIVPGGPTVSAIDALKSQCAAMGKLLDGERQKREEAERALADRIAREAARLNIASAIYQKRAQQAEAQRDMSNAACADAQRALTAAYADLAYANCTIEALTKDAPASQPVPPVGAIVTLKSGGPRMTIVSLNDERVWCSYWNGAAFENVFAPYDCLATLPN